MLYKRILIAALKRKRRRKRRKRKKRSALKRRKLLQVMKKRKKKVHPMMNPCHKKRRQNLLGEAWELRLQVLGQKNQCLHNKLHSQSLNKRKSSNQKHSLLRKISQILELAQAVTVAMTGQISIVHRLRHSHLCSKLQPNQQFRLRLSLSPSQLQTFQMISLVLLHLHSLLLRHQIYQMESQPSQHHHHQMDSSRIPL